GRGGVMERGGDAKPDGQLEAVSRLRGTRVLLVEDNDMNQELATDLLGGVGMTVVVAANGREALDCLLVDDRFDGVLMDCQMPVMDGYTATREIRKNPAWNHLPVIAMTANAMAGDRDKVIEAGMCDHIAKPLNVAEMFATLARWITPSGMVAPETTPAPVSVPVVGGSGGGAEEIPRGIEGLDVESGLKRMVGKRGLYLSMLRKFVAGQQEAPELIRQALAAGDRETAERLAHTLKGTAGNIGAGVIQAGAARLERAIRENRCADAAFQDELSETERLLDALIAALVVALPEEPRAQSAVKEVPAVNWERFAETVMQLGRYLAEDNSEATDLWEEHLESFRVALPDHWQQIAEDIQGFDFESALNRLREAVAPRGLNPS
ncbi:MAG: response regulator, partial [Magnetococcales bacterium]|nr:response regulator [Magnetococcales bacterium]